MDLRMMGMCTILLMMFAFLCQNCLFFSSLMNYSFYLREMASWKFYSSNYDYRILSRWSQRMLTFYQPYLVMKQLLSFFILLLLIRQLLYLFIILPYIITYSLIMEPDKKHRRKKRKQEQPTYKNVNPFKLQEKHYKLYQNQQTDFTTLHTPQQYMDIDGYKVCELPFPQGAYLVKSFNTPQTVLQIGLLGLNVYCNRPYRTNLDSRNQLYEQQKQQKQKQQVQVEMKGEDYYFNEKIRWANVGYQYDWTQRKYPDKKTPIHKSINQLCERANHLYNKIKNTSRNYSPQSAIINYYGVKDYMTGHLDDAQIDQQSPIYSFSFGLSCVFLIGGPTKQEKPTAVRLDSGDLFIMAQYSRKCYHGVPRVLSDSFKQKIQQNGPKEEQLPMEWKNKCRQVQRYYEGHRININVRQVYPKQ